MSKYLTPIIIAGATGSGKSALAIKLAQKHQGEIICADSRQFYQYMPITTACPSEQELALVPHHGFNSVDPGLTKIDAAYFVNFAQQIIKEVQLRGKRPILVGGTGLYLRALRYGFGSIPSSDPQIVSELEQECEQAGLAHLYAELSRIDPKTSALVKPKDRYRIIRALEIYRTTQQPPSLLRKSFSKAKPELAAHWLLKQQPRPELHERLYERVKTMFNLGLVDEAKNLRKKLPPQHWALKIMGIEEALLVGDGQLSLERAIELVFIRHRQYAKRQITWFNKEDFYKYKI